jgi:hypothetical protein
MENKTNSKERVFSVELKSKRNLKNITFTNGSSDSVLVEGTIGELVQATFAEGIILEIVGKKGILRINLKEKELRKEPQSATASENLQNGPCRTAQLKIQSREVKQCK